MNINPSDLITLLAADSASASWAEGVINKNAQFDPKIKITFNNMGQHYGDLGNQMFQAAAIIALSKLHKTIPKIPNSKSEYFKNAGVKLGCFKIQEKMLIDKPIPDAAIIHETSFNLRANRPGFMATAVFGKDIELNKNISLEGFFQYWQLNAYAQSEISSAFSFKQEIEEVALSVLQKIRTHDNHLNKKIVGVHIRLGDQVGDELNHPILTKEYYDNAFKRVKEVYDNPVFLIVSDEPQKCKKIYKNENIIYADELDLSDLQDISERTDLDLDSIFSAPVDMCILSLCDSVIMANSTFSWWAAWLNKSDRIYAPSRNNWFGDILNWKNMSDFYPPDWEEVWFKRSEDSQLSASGLLSLLQPTQTKGDDLA
tara:strand:+ start:22460 stop:23572 length:1113 start_codon:yes stop_codon:yes gene_type:complete